MKINVSNKDKIKNVLDKIQKRQRSRILDYFDVQVLSEQADEYLEKAGIPANLWKDSKVSLCDRLEDGLFSDEKRVSCTMVTLKRGVKSWFMVDCKRVKISTSHNKKDSTIMFISAKSNRWYKKNAVMLLEKGF